MGFPKGHKFAKGGARKGAGRTQEWLKLKCQKLIEKHKLFEFLADVASGECIEYIQNPNGTKTEFKKTCEVRDRMKALEMLSDRGYGKPIQGMELAGKDGQEISWTVVKYAN